MTEFDDAIVVERYTDRLRLCALSLKAMFHFSESHDDDDYKSIYQEMLQAYIYDLDEWYKTPFWTVQLKDETYIGNLSFRESCSFDGGTIRFTILEEFQRQGYATEAVASGVSCVFGNPNLDSIIVEVPSENVATQRVLEKCGFHTRPRLEGEEPVFYFTRGMYNAYRRKEFRRLEKKLSEYRKHWNRPKEKDE